MHDQRAKNAGHALRRRPSIAEFADSGPARNRSLLVVEVSAFDKAKMVRELLLQCDYGFHPVVWSEKIGEAHREVPDFTSF